HVAQPREGGRIRAGPLRVSKQQGSEVLRDEHALQPRLRVEGEMLEEGPGARDVELHVEVVGRIREIAEVDAAAVGADDRADGARGALLRVEQVKEHVDVAAGSMRVVAGDGAARLEAE